MVKGKNFAAATDEPELTNEELAETLTKDPEYGPKLIQAGLAVTGLAGGAIAGVEHLTTAQIEQNLEQAASILKKDVGVVRSVLRNIGKGVAVTGAGILGGVGLGSYHVANGLVAAQSLADAGSAGGALATAVGTMATAPTAVGAGVLAGETAVAPWWDRIGNSAGKALKVLQKTKHFSRKSRRFQFSADGSVAVPALRSEDVVGELIADDDTTKGQVAKTAALAGLASIGVGAAGIEGMKLSEAKAKLDAVSAQLESSVNAPFWTKLRKGICNLFLFPVDEAALQVKNRTLAGVAEGTKPISSLGSKAYKVAQWLK